MISCKFKKFVIIQFLIILSISFVKTNAQDIDYIKLSSFEFPSEITFAGKRIPIEREDVQERMRIIIWKLTRDPTILMIWKARNAKFFPLAREIYKEYGVPLDLLYHFDIESSWSPYSYSSAKAKGVAQFIKSTGNRFLKIDSMMDERRDIEESIIASAKYFLELMEDIKDVYCDLAEVEEDNALKVEFVKIGTSSRREFNAWELVLAAYNSRQTISVINEQKITDFWDGFWSTAEAMEHYPKVLGVKLIMDDPARYGLNFLINSDLFDNYEYDKLETTIYKQFTFLDLAKICRTTFYEIKTLNMGYLIDYFPTGQVTIKMPVGKKVLVKNYLQDNDFFTPNKLALHRSQLMDAGFDIVESDNYNRATLSYRVKPGNTVTRIVWRLLSIGFKVSVKEVISWNNLNSKGTIYPGQKLIIYIPNE